MKFEEVTSEPLSKVVEKRVKRWSEFENSFYGVAPRVRGRGGEKHVARRSADTGMGRNQHQQVTDCSTFFFRTVVTCTDTMKFHLYSRLM